MVEPCDATNYHPAQDNYYQREFDIAFQDVAPLQY